MTAAPKEFGRNCDGVIWADIELREMLGGLRFISPVDGDTFDVAGLTLNEFRIKEWFHGEFYDEILEGVANSGGGDWVFYDGGVTEYDYFENEGKSYLHVKERF